MQLTKPAEFKEAVDKLGSKSVIGSKLNSADWSEMPLALADRAFFSSQIESVRLLQTMKDGLGDFLTGAREVLPDGQVALKVGSRAEFVKQMSSLAQSLGLGPLDPDDKGTLQDITSERRIGLIFDVQTSAAYSYGNWKQGQDPDILDEFPAQRFIRETDVTKPRVIHQQNEGVVKLKSDLDFWMGMNSPVIGGFGVPWGPWGFNSGMGVEDVDRAEAEALGLIKPGEPAQPVEKAFNEKLKASVTNLDPEFIDLLKGQFGNQVKFENGAVWWKGDRKGKALAVTPKPKAPKPQPEPAPAPAPAFPESLDGLQKVRALGGSTGAELVRDPKSGRQFVLKRGNSPAHVREEFAADQLYRALGVPVPDARIYEGKSPVKLAEFIEGKTLKEYLGKATPAERDAVMGKIREHFAADALLGNWDVAGLGLDNILVDGQGMPWRIDNGGSLRFRAQGTAKGADWNNHPTELWSLRDAAKNPQTAQIFGQLDIYQIAGQIDRLDAEKLLAAAPADLKDSLAARMKNLKDIGAKALEYERTQFAAGYADDVTRHMMGLRKAGVVDQVSDGLKQAHPGDVRPVDENGKPFDNLRTTKDQAKADPSQAYFDDILAAVKTVNAHHLKGDTAYNESKLTKAFAHKAALQKMAASGSSQEQAMAAHYLGFLERLEKAKGDKAASVSQFNKFNLAPTKTKNTSAVVDLAAYMKEQGGDWTIVQDWAASQGGSSSSEQSQALKWWLMNRLTGASPADFHNAPSEAAFKKAVAKHGDRYEKTWPVLHAFVQEVLGKMQFEGNDTAARLLRVIRTETAASVVPFKAGKMGVYKRGVNESGSIFAPVFSGTRTLTAVPHTRVTGIYFMERVPGTGHYFFYGDSENEVTYMGYGLETLNLGKNPDLKLTPGTDHTKWETSK